MSKMSPKKSRGFRLIPTALLLIALGAFGQKFTGIIPDRTALQSDNNAVPVSVTDTLNAAVTENQAQNQEEVNIPEIPATEEPSVKTIPDGPAELQFPNGDWYIGQVKNQKFEGNGEYRFKSGDVYKGTFTDSVLADGKLTLKDEKYTGELTYKDKNQESIAVSFLDGSKYEGGFSGNRYNGKGTFTYKTGDTYTGNFTDGKKSGDGKYTFKNGDVYEGKFSEDKFSGIGSYQIKDGLKIEGEFKDGKIFYGKGTGEYEDGTYTVQFNDGKLSKVKLILADTTELFGQIRDGKFSGEMEIKYPSGDFYLGNFKDGVKEGSGTYTWADGSKYKGEWKNNVIEGKGEYYYADKTPFYKLSGTFKDNCPDGKLKIYKTETKSYNSVWSYGTCTEVTN